MEHKRIEHENGIYFCALCVSVCAGTRERRANWMMVYRCCVIALERINWIDETVAVVSIGSKFITAFSFAIRSVQNDWIAATKRTREKMKEEWQKKNRQKFSCLYVIMSTLADCLFDSWMRNIKRFFIIWSAVGFGLCSTHFYFRISSPGSHPYAPHAWSVAPQFTHVLTSVRHFHFHDNNLHTGTLLFIYAIFEFIYGCLCDSCHWMCDATV